LKSRLFANNLAAGSVGTAISNSIYAFADEPETPESWVRFCVRAAEEAHAEVMLNPPLEEKRSVTTRMLDELQGYENPADPLDGDSLAAAACAAAAAAYRSRLSIAAQRTKTRVVGQTRASGLRFSKRVISPCEQASLALRSDHWRMVCGTRFSPSARPPPASWGSPFGPLLHSAAITQPAQTTPGACPHGSESFYRLGAVRKKCTPQPPKE
jgi:hypothetical protein